MLTTDVSTNSNQKPTSTTERTVTTKETSEKELIGSTSVASTKSTTNDTTESYLYLTGNDENIKKESSTQRTNNYITEEVFEITTANYVSSTKVVNTEQDKEELYTSLTTLLVLNGSKEIISEGYSTTTERILDLSEGDEKGNKEPSTLSANDYVELWIPESTSVKYVDRTTLANSEQNKNEFDRISTSSELYIPNTSTENAPSASEQDNGELSSQPTTVSSWVLNQNQNVGVETTSINSQQQFDEGNNDTAYITEFFTTPVSDEYVHSSAAEDISNGFEPTTLQSSTNISDEDNNEYSESYTLQIDNHSASGENQRTTLGLTTIQMSNDVIDGETSETTSTIESSTFLPHLENTSQEELNGWWWYFWGTTTTTDATNSEITYSMESSTFTEDMHTVAEEDQHSTLESIFVESSRQNSDDKNNEQAATTTEISTIPTDNIYPEENDGFNKTTYVNEKTTVAGLTEQQSTFKQQVILNIYTIISETVAQNSNNVFEL